MFQKNNIFEMTCTSLGQDGQGVCRHDGIVVFVPYLLPGETAKVKIVKVEKRFAYGRVESRLNDSPDRQDPFCPIARRCGGCTLQHMTYNASLEYKRKQVEELLHRVGGIDISVPPVLGMSRPIAYRNKGMYPVGIQNNSVVCGFYAQRSHNIIPLPLQGCQLQDEFSAKVISIVTNWINTYHVPVYNEQQHTGLIRHLMTRRTQAGEIMVVLVVKSPDVPFLAELKTSLIGDLPQTQCICLSINPKPGNTILGTDIRPVFGIPEMKDTLLGLSFTVSPLSFFQVNPAQTKVLYQLAIDFAGLTGNETVIDAYCGTGTISLLMAQHARQVIGIEIVEPAVENAKRNALENNIQNVSFLLGAAESVLPDLVDQQMHPDVIVLDPPRKGCDRAVLDAIVRANPDRIVYISCGASTLARDLSILAQNNYYPQQIQCVDMFCWTSSIETVLSLSQRKPD